MEGRTGGKGVGEDRKKLNKAVKRVEIGKS